jgi:hypothetical protein
VVAAYDAYVKNDLTPESFINDVAPFNSTRQRITEFNWELADTTVKTTGAPAAPAGGAAALPLKAKLVVDFSGAGKTLDVVDKSANDMLEAMKEKLPQYEITADQFPWQKEEGSHNEEVAVEVNSPSSIVVSNASGTINFRGIRKVTPGQPAAGQAATPATRPGIGRTQRGVAQ